MDLFTAIRERRSCRSFLDDPIDEAVLEKIIEAGTWAPSPMNAQPWEFIVVTSPEMKEKIYAEAERCRQWALRTSGWNWLDKYRIEFLKNVPAFVVVIGDPKKSGVDKFMEDGSVGLSVRLRRRRPEHDAGRSGAGNGQPMVYAL